MAESPDVLRIEQAAFRLNVGENAIREYVNRWLAAVERGVPEASIDGPWLRCLPRPTSKSPIKVPVSEIQQHIERELARVR